MARKRVVLHIGMHKTGTTAFQSFCIDHWEALQSKGFLYPVAGRPSVSPDGEKIAFAGNADQYSQAQNQIWVVEPPNKPFRLEKGDDLSAIQGRSPNWSPNGDLIVFESTRPFLHPDPCTALAIWVMNSDGTNPRQLTDRALFSASHAEWSRQQTQIVFAGQGEGIGIIDFAAGG